MSGKIDAGKLKEWILNETESGSPSGTHSFMVLDRLLGAVKTGRLNADPSPVQADTRPADWVSERVDLLEQVVRDLLLSADAAWEQRGEGHDWAEACKRARKAVPIMISQNWLKRRIETDPDDIEVEAGILHPEAQQPPAQE